MQISLQSCTIICIGGIDMAYLMDLHVYTNNTPGTKDKISFLCETAVEKNIRALAFTDIITPETDSRVDLKRQVRHAFLISPR